MKVGILVLLVLAATVGSSAQQLSGIQRLAWLQGCWELESPDGIIEEHWMAPLGKSMVGTSRTVGSDSLVAFEVMVIREKDEGFVLEAHPSGQQAAIFHSKAGLDSAVVFENLDHDFPQRIGYRRSSPDSLYAWIEGTMNGEVGRLEFLYRRALCPGN